MKLISFTKLKEQIFKLDMKTGPRGLPFRQQIYDAMHKCLVDPADLELGVLGMWEELKKWLRSKYRKPLPEDLPWRVRSAAQSAFGMTQTQIKRLESGLALEPIAEAQDAVSRKEAIHELETIPIGTEEGPELIAKRAVRIIKDLSPRALVPAPECRDAVSRSSLVAIISCLRRSSENDYWCGWNMALRAVGDELTKLPPVLPAESRRSEAEIRAAIENLKNRRGGPNLGEEALRFEYWEGAIAFALLLLKEHQVIWDETKFFTPSGDSLVKTQDKRKEETGGG